jgi:hypothetical protein
LPRIDYGYSERAPKTDRKGALKPSTYNLIPHSSLREVVKEFARRNRLFLRKTRPASKRKGEEDKAPNTGIRFFLLHLWNNSGMDTRK